MMTKKASLTNDVPLLQWLIPKYLVLLTVLFLPNGIARLPCVNPSPAKLPPSLPFTLAPPGVEPAPSLCPPRCVTCSSSWRTRSSSPLMSDTLLWVTELRGDNARPVLQRPETGRAWSRVVWAAADDPPRAHSASTTAASCSCSIEELRDARRRCPKGRARRGRVTRSSGW